MQGEELLNDSEQSYFNKFRDIFESDEWQLLVEEWQKEIDAIPLRAFESANSWDEILAARALVQKLREYLAYPAELDLRKEQAIHQREQELVEQTEGGRSDV